VNDVVTGFKWIGTRPIRPDGVPKVTGRAMYAADMAMPGQLVGKILRSPHAHARIRSINTVKAHTRHLYNKLGAHTRSEAVEQARALHLLASSSRSPGERGQK